MTRPEPASTGGLRARIGRLARRCLAWCRALATRPTAKTRARQLPTDAPIIESEGQASASNGRLTLVPWIRPSRHYLLLAPGQPRQPLKLLVCLHGCRQDSAGFASASRFRRWTEGGDWMVLLPSQTRLANLDGCWNWFDSRTIAGDGETAIVSAMIDEIRRAHGIDARHTYLAGMSSGAALAAALAVHSPSEFTAAAFHSGVPFAATDSALRARSVLRDGPRGDVTLNLPSTGRLPAIIVHGLDDKAVNERHARELMRQMLTLNGQLAPGEPLPAPHDESMQVIGQRRTRLSAFDEHRLVLVEGLGHAWSGGDPDWPYNDPLGPDATAMMRAFFEGVSR
jgi:poly(3-hydroxybutyrate) depolymerase